MVYFKFETKKAIEAAATLLRLVRRRVMDRKRLLALLYIADRRCLQRTGRPIIGGRLVAMDHGPIHSEVYDLIKGSHGDQSDWSRHFENDSYRVCLIDDTVAVCALSRYEVELLNEISQEYAGFDTWDVANDTHHFKEYLKNFTEGTSTQISLEDLVDAVGRKRDKKEILQDAEEKAFFDKLFAGTK